MSFAQHPQDVTTWHNDTNRTGWQSNEPTLTTDPTKPGFVSQSTFGLLQKWSVQGYVYAQPLAIAGVPAQLTNCNPSCDMVFVATEQDMLYAFKAPGPTTAPAPPLWSIDLAGSIVIGNTHGTPVSCSPTTEDPCSQDSLGPYEGVTGTPVIDMQTHPYTLYVVAAVSFGTTTCQNNDPICFYLYAVDVRTGGVTDRKVISATVNGFSPVGNLGDCKSTLPHSGQITFEYHHPQRAALLVLPNGTVYVAFAAGNGDQYGETNNGWIFAYTLNSAALTQTNRFNSTPYGTGGGIWQSGGGPAYDGSHIYANTANGTLFDALQQLIPDDIGDSLLQLDPATLTVTDFYSPFNAFSYSGSKGTGLCINDEDFGSGGVLAVPAPFTYNSMSVVITADKQSNLYVSDRGNLGKFSPGPSPACPSTPNNIQCLTTPHDGQNQKLAPTQGYWGSPAFWHYNDGTDHYMLYYSPTVETAKPNDDSDKAPYPLYGFQLNTSSTSGPPIPDPATTSTLNVKFCPRSPTPTVSSNGSLDPASGIVWAIEHQNRANANNQCNLAEYPGAALHAFKATDLTAPELYSSRHNNPQGAIGGEFTKFSTPTVFNGQVYVGTQGEVDVYGLCPQGGCH